MTLVSKSVGIWDDIVNPIYGCVVEITPDIIIGVVAIGTLGTQALPNKERNLSIRNQKVFKYWAQYKEISSKFKWIVLNLGHQQLILLSSQYCTWNISNRNQEREKVPSLENASTTPMGISGKGLQVHTITVKTIFMFWDKQGNIEHSHKCLLKDLMKLSVEYITSSCYRY